MRIVVPARLEGAAQDLQKVAWGQMASPLKDPILTELRWYFDHRAGGLAGLSEPADRRRFERCEHAFATDRYTILYRRWREDGEGDKRLGRQVPCRADASELIRLCRTGRLYEVEAWIRAGRSLAVPREVRTTPLDVALDTGFHISSSSWHQRSRAISRSRCSKAEALVIAAGSRFVSWPVAAPRHRPSLANSTLGAIILRTSSSGPRAYDEA
jgi:hypothetical protein